MTSFHPCALIWYRADLRLHDHEPLCRAVAESETVLPVYVIDPRLWGDTSFGFIKTGVFRTQFLRQGLEALHQQLAERGSGLLVLYGKPEAVLPALARKVGATAVYAHTEPMPEEQWVERQLAEALQHQNITLHTCWGHTLLHPDDLPFSLEHLPDVFTQFRQAVEANLWVRQELAAPGHIPTPAEVPASDAFPEYAVLDLPDPPAPDPRAVLPFSGGEAQALMRLDHYLWQTDGLATYKATRNGMLGPDYSSKLSAWLAQGSLSPRTVYHAVKRYERERTRNESTYWLVFELLWRDYFRLLGARHGAALFLPQGLQGRPVPWATDWPLFTAWQHGLTGIPLVDANMRELYHTGFMSNRGRQNVASFLTKNLGLDWRMGAEWFESRLLDYDVTSNYGNWQYAAGVGTDARGFRYFNLVRQSQEYDPQAAYIKTWCPELAALPTDWAHQPWLLNEADQERWGVRLGADYPHPVVDLEASVAHQQMLYEQALPDPRLRKGNYKLRRAMRR